MTDGADPVEQAKELLEECDVAFIIAAMDDEGVQTFILDEDADEAPPVSTVTLLTTAGQDFLEQLEAWAIDTAAQRGLPDSLERSGETLHDVTGTPDDVGDPHGPEFQ